MTDRLLTLRQLEDRWQVTRQTLWKWRAAGWLPVVRVRGRHIRVRPADAERLDESLRDVNLRNPA